MLQLEMPISPCIDICRMDGEGLCEGCRRTIEEIGAWSQMTAGARLGVWRELVVRGYRRVPGAKPVPPELTPTTGPRASAANETH